MRVLADFDGDGRDDIAELSTDTVMVAFAAGGKTTIRLMGLERQSVDYVLRVGGDFDGDGLADLAVATTPAKSVEEALNSAPDKPTTIRVFLNRGKKFTRGRVWATERVTAESQHSWAVGDFDGDGHDDLVAVKERGGEFPVGDDRDPTDGRLVLLTSNGARFAALPARRAIPDSATLIAITAVDSDHDGTDELAEHHRESGDELHLWRAGPSGLTRGESITDQLANDMWLTLATSDVNGDGVPDLLFVPEGVEDDAEEILVSLGTSSGFENPVYWATCPKCHYSVNALDAIG